MLPYVVRPLEPWLGSRTRFPRSASFRAGWKDTLEDLSYEIGRLGATSFVLQCDITEHDLRRDGGIRANAMPYSVAVRVTFNSPVRGDLSFSADQYDDWRDNIRAIALTLSALRAVDRYGVASSGEQYRGWTAISNRPAQMTREQAAEFIAHWAGFSTSVDILRDGGLDAAYRMAAKRAHPDVTGDDGDLMARLNVARDLLRAER